MLARTETTDFEMEESGKNELEQISKTKETSGRYRTVCTLIHIPSTSLEPESPPSSLCLWWYFQERMIKKKRPNDVTSRTETAGIHDHQFIDSVYRRSIWLCITINSKRGPPARHTFLAHERIRSCHEGNKLSPPAPYMQWNRCISQPMKLLRTSVPNDFLPLERKGKTALV
jgi:hypothetical protein